MSTEGHKAAMQADYSPTLDESIDPPLYEADDMNAVVRWAIVAVAVLAMLCAVLPVVL
jgi:hypothetical protein